MIKKLYILIILFVMQSNSSWQEHEWSELFNKPFEGRSTGTTNSEILKYHEIPIVPEDTVTIGSLLKHASYSAQRIKDSDNYIKDSVIIFDNRPVYWKRFEKRFDTVDDSIETFETVYEQLLSDSLIEYEWYKPELCDSLPEQKRVTKYNDGLPISVAWYELDEYIQIDSVWTFKLFKYDSTVFSYNDDNLLDSALRYRFDEDFNVWYKWSLNSYTYNNNQQLEEEIRSSWTGDSYWDINSSKSYAYNSTGYCTTYTDDGKNYNYSYDGEGKKTGSYMTYSKKFYEFDTTLQIEQKTTIDWSIAKDTMISLTYANDTADTSIHFLVDSTKKVFDVSGNLLSKYVKHISWALQGNWEDTIVNVTIDTAGISQYLWLYSYNSEGLPIERVRKTYRGGAWEVDTTEIITWLPEVSIHSSAIKNSANILIKEFTHALFLQLPSINNNVKFSVTDLKGRVVDEKVVLAQSLRNGWKWNNNNLASGIYLYNISAMGLSYTGKILIRR